MAKSTSRTGVPQRHKAEPEVQEQAHPAETANRRRSTAGPRPHRAARSDESRPSPAGKPAANPRARTNVNPRTSRTRNA